MGIKSRVEHLVKFNKGANSLYVAVASTCVKALGIARPIQDNLVLISSDIGKNYTGSPRALYEKMLELGLDRTYEIVWAFADPERHAGEIPSRIVKLDTPEYFKVAMRARYWITDVNIERGLRFKRRGTTYLNTWHGSSFKALGNDIHGRIYYDCSSIDYLCVNSEYDKRTFAHAFDIDPKIYVESGLPRNDELYAHADEDRSAYKRRVGLPCDKKVVLYAPTWRDSDDAGKSYTIAPPLTLQKWEEALSDNCVLVFRMHPLTQKALGVVENDFLRDYSSYQPLNDLLLASDVLITDYSSLAFDFSILKRPVFCFGYDADDYARVRGLYVDLETVFPHGVQHTEDELLQLLKKPSSWVSDGTNSVSSHYNEFGGHATEECLELLFGKTDE